MNLINNTTNEIVSFNIFNESRRLSNSDIDFESYGYSVINEVPVPDHIEMIDSIAEGAPEFIDGLWYQTWIVTDTTVGMTPTELAEVRDRVLSEMHTRLADYRYDTETLKISKPIISINFIRLIKATNSRTNRFELNLTFRDQDPVSQLPDFKDLEQLDPRTTTN